MSEPTSTGLGTWTRHFNAEIRAALAADREAAMDELRQVSREIGEAQEGPTDEELWSMYRAAPCRGPFEDAARFARAVLACWGHQPAPAEGLAVRPLLEQVAAIGDCIGEQTVGQIAALADRAAAWLAANPPGQPVAIEPRGCPTPGACSCVEASPTPPTEGEAAALMIMLRQAGEALRAYFLTAHARACDSAADMLEQRHAAPVPVAVSERLPDASDPGECRMPDGDCWWFDPHADGAWYMDTYQSCYTHWLPAHALPLPSGEVEG